MSPEQTLSHLYAKAVGCNPTCITPLPASGSYRKYFRMEGPQHLIGAAGWSVPENEAFFYIGNHLKSKGIPVPEIVAISDDRLIYLQEDLGDITLFQAIVEGRETGNFSREETSLIEKTVKLLPCVQMKGAEGFDSSRCYPPVGFDIRTIMWDLNYFKYCFLKSIKIDFEEDKLENDFETLSKLLLNIEPKGLMYRDFQSRNIMIRDNEPWLIDFQGARIGPCHYDLASLLWQAKAKMPDHLRCEMVDKYLDALREFEGVDKERFKEDLRYIVLFRTLQVLGAYGFRGYLERKPHFLQSIPFAIENLRSLFDKNFNEIPYLSSLLQSIVQRKDLQAHQPSPLPGDSEPSLTVEVVSFSYKKGLPVDASGNGGGFIFDCRALHNPGRYEQYKNSTGRDLEVVRFLEAEKEVHEFVHDCSSLVFQSVKRYLQRGFTHLFVTFGCTGGQHRSVYCAQRLAEMVNEKFGVKVLLEHREQGITQELPSHKIPQES